MLVSVILGSAVGLISSILGLGGGILIVPLLPLFTDLSRKESVFVSLVTILIIVSVNTYFYFRKKTLNVKAVLIFGPLTGLGSVIAVQFISPQLTDQHIKNILSVVLMFWGLFNIYKLFFKKSTGKEGQHALSAFVFLSLFAGVLSGLLGIGSGLILSLMLVGISWIKSEEISPTSNGIMVFTTLFASITYALQVNLSEVSGQLVNYTIPIAGAAIFTSIWGRRVQHKLSRQARGGILVSLLIVLSVKTFLASN